VRFTPSAGPEAVRIDAVDGLARLIVADTGRGIDPAFLPHVFVRFAQEEGRELRGPPPGQRLNAQDLNVHAAGP
jgi:signal transduction histidine kinase